MMSWKKQWQKHFQPRCQTMLVWILCLSTYFYGIGICILPGAIPAIQESQPEIRHVPDGGPAATERILLPETQAAKGLPLQSVQRSIKFKILKYYIFNVWEEQKSFLLYMYLPRTRRFFILSGENRVKILTGQLFSRKFSRTLKRREAF